MKIRLAQFNQNIGNATQVSAGGLPSGFRAFVRIVAVNACGQSAPTADVLVAEGTSGGGSDLQVTLGTITGRTGTRATDERPESWPEDKSTQQVR